MSDSKKKQKILRLYDFNASTAALTLAMYLVLFAISIFVSIFNPQLRVGGIVFTIIFAVSFIAIIWYFVFIPVIIDEKCIRHGKKCFLRENVIWGIQYNERYKTDEIIVQDTSRNYLRMSDAEVLKNQIRVGYSKKYEELMREQFDNTLKMPKRKESNEIK